MEKRLNVQEKATGVLKAMYGLGAYLDRSTIGKELLELIYFRVSQINGCAYCLDMHSKELRAMGETEQRLYMIAAWRETPFFSDREKAALAWAEAVTKLTNGDVSTEVYDLARKHFTEQELVDLTAGVIAINGYNRLNIAFRAEGGHYRVGQFKVASN